MNIFTYTLIKFIKIYKFFISPLIGPSCRYLPTCSEYTIEALKTYGFLKGPIDMLTLYEQKYKEEVQKFANEQVGRRRRDDYTDGTVRIPVTSANP